MYYLFKDYFSFRCVDIDDILNMSKDMNEHTKYPEMFLDVCYKDRLVLCEKKTVIATQK